LDTNFNACLKLQNVSGYLGYTSSMFILLPLLSLLIYLLKGWNG
jgi:hypothetical protein